MAAGFVAGFLKKDRTWHSHWIQVNAPGRQRFTVLHESRDELAEKLGIHCGGPGVARRNMIVIDGLTPHGRELIEIVFEAMRESAEGP